jgi:hypothetical protein
MLRKKQMLSKREQKETEIESTTVKDYTEAVYVRNTFSEPEGIQCTAEPAY